MEANKDQTPVTYELDHLASFGVTTKQGDLPASAAVKVGLDRLKQMESTTGVWAMKVILRIDRRQIVVIDRASLKVSHTHDNYVDAAGASVIIIIIIITVKCL